MLHAYWYMTKMRLLTNLTYRFEVFASVGTNLIMMIAVVYLWKAAYGNGIVQPDSAALHELIVYTIISVLMGSMFICDVQDTIFYRIREGQIVTDFYRPVPLLASYLADDLGSMLSAFLNQVLPLFVFASLFFGVPWPASAEAFLLFIPSCILSYAILWLLSALVGLIAFWVMELGNIGIVKNAIVRILSGSLVPLWFFPGKVQTISNYLPFKYTYQTPISIYIGQTNAAAAAESMLIQLAWIAVLLLAAARFWKLTKKKTLIQGG